MSITTNNTQVRTSMRQAGFTIIELLIATVVSSVLILGILAAFIQITRYFTKGLTQATTQKVARSVVEELSQNIQTTTGGIVTPFTDSGFQLFCIGHSRYSYQIINITSPGDEIDASDHWKGALYVEEDLGADVGQSTDACRTGGGQTNKNFVESRVRGSVSSPETGEGKNILGDNMILSNFVLEPLESVASPRLYRIVVEILNVPNDAVNSKIFDQPSRACKGTSVSGGEFCAMSTLETNAFRLNKLKY